MTTVGASTRLVSRTRLLAEPEGLLATLGACPDGFVWFHDGRALVTSGVAARIPLDTGPGRIERAAKRVQDVLGSIESEDPLRLPGTGPIAAGAIPFGDGAEGELIVPAVVAGRTRSGQGWVTETAVQGWTVAPVLEPVLEPELAGLATTAVSASATSPPGVRPRQSRHDWEAAVRGLLQRIAGGHLEKVVLAREVVAESRWPIDRAALLTELSRVHPSCFTFAAGSFVGSSPELLVRRRGVRVVSRPMAGTVGRGATADGDVRLAAGLLSSQKELGEHAVVVEAVRAGLAPVCSEVFSRPQPEVVQLSTVAHLATTVGGWLHCPAPSALALAGVLHPTPAVAGSPRDPALAAIAELESFDRGPYGGPVGWVDSRGDGDWAVALRCARLDGRRAHLVAGAGIVAGSDPAAEWDETEAKFRTMLEALGVR